MEGRKEGERETAGGVGEEGERVGEEGKREGCLTVGMVVVAVVDP